MGMVPSIVALASGLTLRLGASMPTPGLDAVLLLYALGELGV